MKIKVISPGMLSTIQDGGRHGYLASGFASGGAMDAESLQIANILVGNDKFDACIEMTMMGGTFEFDETCVIAVTGADMNAMINDEELPMYCAVEVKKGNIIRFAAAKNGMRTYFAVFGSFGIEPVLGSCSTNLKVAIGGLNGKALAKEDEIPLKTESSLNLIGRRTAKFKINSERCKTVRVLLGPQDDLFSENGLETFLASEYIVTDKSDRMGIRLDGEKIESKNGVDIISDGIAFGSIQIPASGQPIVMMADRQTVGGYAKIATVLTADLPLMAQARAGDKIRFAAVSEKEADKIYKEYCKKIQLFEYEMMFER